MKPGWHGIAVENIYMKRERRIIIVAGPNGAGKTTFALADAWTLYDNAGSTPVLLELEEHK